MKIRQDVASRTCISSLVVDVDVARQKLWREHKHAAIRVSALRKGPVAATDEGRCRGSFTFRYPVDGNRAAARQSSSLFSFFFLFLFAHLDTSAPSRLSPFEKFFSLPTAQFFLRVETKHSCTRLMHRDACAPRKGRPRRRGISGGEKEETR